MRIVKIVEPVACTVENCLGRIIRLEEGQLLTVARAEVMVLRY
jgi:hypothetical protein